MGVRLYIALNLSQVRKISNLSKGGNVAKAKTGVIRQGSVGNLSHNRRVILGEAHIDYSRQNIVLVRQTLQEAYAGAFGEAVAEYNSGQKRKDRRIDDYYRHLFKCDYSPVVQEAAKRGKNKHAQKSFYENIIQIGNKYNSGVDSEDAPLVTECLRLWFEGCPELGIPSYQERNPNIYVFEASIHLDEATPHIQLDYIPMAFVNEKGNGRLGLSVQNSHSRALAEMGFGDDKDSLIRWREHEVEKYLVPIMKSRGIEWIPPDKENKQDYIPPQELREKGAAIEAELEAKAAEVEIKSAELESLQAEVSAENTKLAIAEVKTEKAQERLQQYTDLTVAVDEVGDIGVKSKLSKNIVVPPDEYALLQEQAKSFRANKPKIENLNNRERELAEKERSIDSANRERQQQLDTREQRLKSEELRIKESDKRNNATYKQVQELFDIATMGNLTPQTCGEMKSEISGLKNEVGVLQQQVAVRDSDIGKLKREVQNRVTHEEHSKVFRECNQQRVQNESLQRRLLQSEQSLKSANDTNSKLKEEIAVKDKTIASLRTLCRDIYEAFRNVIKAVKKFKYGKDKYKVDNLSEEQGRLIDSVVDYGVKWAKEDGHTDIATQIRDDVGISEGIQECIDKRTPQVPTRSVGRK